MTTDPELSASELRSTRYGGVDFDIKTIVINLNPGEATATAQLDSIAAAGR